MSSHKDNALPMYEKKFVTIRLSKYINEIIHTNFVCIYKLISTTMETRWLLCSVPNAMASGGVSDLRMIAIF